MLSDKRANDYYFTLALWLNSSCLEKYSNDDDIQHIVDVIAYEDRIDDLLRVCDFYYIDLHTTNDDDQYLLGEAFAKHIGAVSQLFSFHFNSGAGRLYFVGTSEEVFAKVKRLS